MVKPTNTQRLRDAYVSCVFLDPLFVEKCRNIISSIRTNKEVLSWGVSFGKPVLVFGVDQIITLDNSVVDEFLDLAVEFDIHIIDVTEYLNGRSLIRSSGVTIDVTSLWSDDPSEHFTIDVSPGATKQDVIDSLSDFDYYMERAYGNHIKKNKAPENYQLVYAVHRARKSNLKFQEIFDLYKDGDLPNYQGSKNLSSVEKLKDYYYKYRVK